MLTASTSFCTSYEPRYRQLPDINARNSHKRGHMERAAINTPIQGGAADVVMMAMIKLGHHTRLKELGWKLLLQIHDEVILEGPEESTEEALALVNDSRCLLCCFWLFVIQRFGLIVSLSVNSEME